MTDAAYRVPEAVRKHLDALAHDVCNASLDGYETQITCTREAGHTGRHDHHLRISWPAE